MGMNSGLFDSPNSRHSERSYQITHKKESAQLRNYTFISVSATRLFRPFWPIKHPKNKMEYNRGVSLLEQPRGHRD